MNHNPQGSSVHGIFRARLLEWVAISSSRGSSWPRDRTHISWAPALHSDSLGKPWSSFRQWEFIVNDAWFTVYKVILSKYNPKNNYNRGFILKCFIFLFFLVCNSLYLKFSLELFYFKLMVSLITCLLFFKMDDMPSVSPSIPCLVPPISKWHTVNRFLYVDFMHVYYVYF